MEDRTQKAHSEIEYRRVFEVFNHFKNATYLKKENVVFYAAGHSFRTQEHIDRLLLKFPIKLKTHQTSRQGLFWLVPMPMPRNFVIKILKPDCLIELFNGLLDFLIIDFFVFDQSLEPDFLAEKMSLHKTFGKDTVKRDDGYLIYGVDTEASETGVLEFVSYGPNAPEELTCFFSREDDCQQNPIF